jgi:hypothetical protein
MVDCICCLEGYGDTSNTINCNGEALHSFELCFDFLDLWMGLFPELGIVLDVGGPLQLKAMATLSGTRRIRDWPCFRDQCSAVHALSQVRHRFPHWPLSKTLTLPSPPTKYNSSFASICTSHFAACASPTPILTTPLTSLAVPVSSNLKFIVRCA